MLSMPVHTHTYAEGYISSFKHTLMNIQIDVFYKHIPSSSREISTVVPPPQPSIRRDLSPVAWRARRPKAAQGGGGEHAGRASRSAPRPGLGCCPR